jgi:hypothetical protein
LYKDTDLYPFNIAIPMPAEQWYSRQAASHPGPQDPAAYIRGSTPEVLATFQVFNPLYNLPNVRIQGVLTSLELRPWQKAFSIQLNAAPAGPVAIQNGKATVTVQGAQPLPDKVDYYSMGIKWTASADGVSWYTAGFSQNPIYLLYAQPRNSGQLLQTFVDLGSRVGVEKAIAAGYADAQTKAKSIFDGIWAGFSDRKVTRADGQPLYYYHSWDFPPSGKRSEQQLVTGQDGQCVAWSLLLLQVLRAQGLTADPLFKDVVHLIKVIPPETDNGFLVKSWTFKPEFDKTKGLLQYTNINTTGAAMDIEGKGTDVLKVYPQWEKVSGKFQYHWISAAANYDAKTTVGGQNNPSPQAVFTDHAIVQVGSMYFDPSYGLTYKDAKDFQSQAIAGFYVREFVNDGQGTRRFKIRPANPSPEQAEVSFKDVTSDFFPEV